MFFSDKVLLNALYGPDEKRLDWELGLSFGLEAPQGLVQHSGFRGAQFEKLCPGSLHSAFGSQINLLPWFSCGLSYYVFFIF